MYNISLLLHHRKILEQKQHEINKLLVSYKIDSPIENISSEDNELVIEKNNSISIDIEPLETIPLETIPLETIPLETIPLKTIPLETIPLETIPLETIPLDSDETKEFKTIELYIDDDSEISKNIKLETVDEDDIMLKNKLTKMKKKELLEYSKTLELDIHKKTRKADIISIIEQNISRN